MSVATAGQTIEVMEKLRGKNRAQLQRLTDNWDLAELIMKHDTGDVDRRQFEWLLSGTLELPNPLQRYRRLLLSLSAQRQALRFYNEQYWDNRFTHAELDALDITSNHSQSVYDLEFFHVQFDSWQETVEMWWRVYVGEHPGSWRWSELLFDPKHFRLFAANVRQYMPGIHRVRINLLAHWEPKVGRTLEQVCDRVRGTNEILAQFEVMSAYGLHTGLFQAQDGRSLPYADMAGTDVLIGRLSTHAVLRVDWDFDDCIARLGASWAVDPSTSRAAPVMLPTA